MNRFDGLGDVVLVVAAVDVVDQGLSVGIYESQPALV